MSPRETLTASRLDDPGTLAHEMSIYKERVRIRKESLKGKKPMDALVDYFRRQQYRFQYECDREGQITRLSFSHPISLDLLHEYPHALLMDCTYKTNIFGMPLLHVVDLNSVYTLFFVCFVFLRNEDTESYK